MERARRLCGALDRSKKDRNLGRTAHRHGSARNAPPSERLDVATHTCGQFSESVEPAAAGSCQTMNRRRVSLPAEIGIVLGVEAFTFPARIFLRSDRRRFPKMPGDGHCSFPTTHRPQPLQRSRTSIFCARAGAPPARLLLRYSQTGISSTPKRLSSDSSACDAGVKRSRARAAYISSSSATADDDASSSCLRACSRVSPAPAWSDRIGRGVRRWAL